MLRVLISVSLILSSVSIAANDLSLGVVQRSISIGMPTLEVIETLGSPNMVTSDSQQREVWVYDRVSTTSVTKRKSSGVQMLLLGGGGNASGGIGGGTSSSKTVNETSTRNLTIIIKFNEEGFVRDFSYRSANF